MLAFRDIELKLGNMRKPQSFTMYPNNPDETGAKLQSDNRCLLVDLTTGEGLLSRSVADYPRFHHCSAQFGAMVVEVGADVLERLRTMSGHGVGTEVEVTGANVTSASY